MDEPPVTVNEPPVVTMSPHFSIRRTGVSAFSEAVMVVTKLPPLMVTLPMSHSTHAWLTLEALTFSKLVW